MRFTLKKAVLQLLGWVCVRLQPGYHNAVQVQFRVKHKSTTTIAVSRPASHKPDAVAVQHQLLQMHQAFQPINARDVVVLEKQRTQRRHGAELKAAD